MASKKFTGFYPFHNPLFSSLNHTIHTPAYLFFHRYIVFLYLIELFNGLHFLISRSLTYGADCYPGQTGYIKGYSPSIIPLSSPLNSYNSYTSLLIFSSVYRILVHSSLLTAQKKYLYNK